MSNLYDRKTSQTKNEKGKRRSFESIGKNFYIIAHKMMKNERLMKLLLITNENADSPGQTLSDDEVGKAFNDNIRTTPNIDKDTGIKNYIVIQAGAFSPTSNESYMNYFISFDIICNMRNWQMKDYTPRPYKIMEEIHAMLNQTKIDSLGPVQFVSGTNLVINEEMAGFTLTYQVVSE